VDLTQVRSAPPTCKRTPHCKDDKHGERHDDMGRAIVELKEGVVGRLFSAPSDAIARPADSPRQQKWERQRLWRFLSMRLDGPKVNIFLEVTNGQPDQMKR
ncbi:hypothetical protein B296_00041694, partial [Ensete ventricosum]